MMQNHDLNIEDKVICMQLNMNGTVLVNDLVAW